MSFPQTLTVRLPDTEAERLDRIATTSLRSTSSLTAFAAAHLLGMARSDSGVLARVAADHGRGATTDRRCRMSITDRAHRAMIQTLLDRLDDAGHPLIVPAALRAALLAWLASGTDSDLISQIGAPAVEEHCAT